MKRNQSLISSYFSPSTQSPYLASPLPPSPITPLPERGPIDPVVDFAFAFNSGSGSGSGSGSEFGPVSPYQGTLEERKPSTPRRFLLSGRWRKPKRKRRQLKKQRVEQKEEEEEQKENLGEEKDQDQDQDQKKEKEKDEEEERKNETDQDGFRKPLSKKETEISKNECKNKSKSKSKSESVSSDSSCETSDESDEDSENSEHSQEEKAQKEKERKEKTLKTKQKHKLAEQQRRHNHKERICQLAESQRKHKIIHLKEENQILQEEMKQNQNQKQKQTKKQKQQQIKKQKSKEKISRIMVLTEAVSTQQNFFALHNSSLSDEERHDAAKQLSALYPGLDLSFSLVSSPRFGSMSPFPSLSPFFSGSLSPLGSVMTPTMPKVSSGDLQAKEREKEKERNISFESCVEKTNVSESELKFENQNETQNEMQRLKQIRVHSDLFFPETPPLSPFSSNSNSNSTPELSSYSQETKTPQNSTMTIFPWCLIDSSYKVLEMNQKFLDFLNSLFPDDSPPIQAFSIPSFSLLSLLDRKSEQQLQNTVSCLKTTVVGFEEKEKKEKKEKFSCQQKKCSDLLFFTAQNLSELCKTNNKHAEKWRDKTATCVVVIKKTSEHEIFIID